MDRAPTPAGPLFRSRSFRASEEQTIMNTKVHPPSQDVARDRIPTADLLNRPLAKHRRHLRDVSNGMVASQYSDLGNYSQRCRLPQERYRKQTNKTILPYVNEVYNRTSCGKGMLRTPTAERRKQGDFSSPGHHTTAIPQPSPRRTVKFHSLGSHNLTANTLKEEPTENTRYVSCQVTGISIGKDDTRIGPRSRKIRIIQRSKNSTSNLALYRRKLQQNLDMKFISDSTALPSDCMLRKDDCTAVPYQTQSKLVHRPSQHRTHPNGNILFPVSPKNNTQVERMDGAKMDKDENANNLSRQFSYRLAEKAEEFFTRSLRHTKENAPKLNVIKTYAVEGNPADFLQKLDNISPVSLTIKNLEVHNSWWTSTDTRGGDKQKATAKEHRVRRWVEETQATSRFGRARLVNIVVKDPGFSVQNSRDNVMERASQVQSQVLSQVQSQVLSQVMA